MGIDLDTFAPKPAVRGLGSHGGYCGPAVKPIALHMVSAIAADPEIRLPISGIGGVQAWQDAAEFLLLGARCVQVCAAVMHYGFRIVDQLKSGLEGWMRQKSFARVSDFVGKSVPRIKTWGDLDLNYKLVARIDQSSCIHCGLCYIACEDGCHQSIRHERVGLPEFLQTDGHSAHLLRSGGHEVVPGAGGDVVNIFAVKEDTCVGCNMCSLVCPVEGCISMVEIENGKVPMTWNEYQAKLGRGEMEKIAPPEHV
jgi:dihydropyrimidine dehydrogenase (NAD+) subunit PreA